ncbi:MAG: hypothetical protein IT563_10575 [Alphaproteobacteria bacterium]|nr:hypothetical protein [Alphaproteobacteria bacterium]
MKTIGIVLVVAGLVAGGLLYSNRPMEGLESTVTRVVQGQDRFLKPPVYYTGMALCAAAIVLGVVALVRK